VLEKGHPAFGSKLPLVILRGRTFRRLVQVDANPRDAVWSEWQERRCKKRLHVQVVFGSSSRASRESIDKGRRPCRKSSSWIGGVLLTHTRPHKCVWIGEQTSDIYTGKDGKEGPESGLLGGVAVRHNGERRGPRRVDHASDSVPD